MQIKLLTFLFYSVNNFLLICFAVVKTTLIFAYQITTSNEAGWGRGKKMDAINNKIQEIKNLLGIELTPCDYFTGIKNHNGESYFNVVLTERVCESAVYNKLINILPFGLISKVEPNGLNRLALFF